MRLRPWSVALVVVLMAFGCEPKDGETPGTTDPEGGVKGGGQPGGGDDGGDGTDGVVDGKGDNDGGSDSMDAGDGENDDDSDSDNDDDDDDDDDDDTFVPSTQVLTSINFEDAFGELQGYGSLKFISLPAQVNGVRFLRKDTNDSLIVFAGGYSNGDHTALNESFATDYVGLSTHDDGIRVVFPTKISSVSFQTRGCACAGQGQFDVVVGGAVLQTFGPADIDDEPTVTVNFATPTADFILRNVSGSTALMPMDNLVWIPVEYDDNQMLHALDDNEKPYLFTTSDIALQTSYGTMFVEGETVGTAVNDYDQMESAVMAVRAAKPTKSICVLVTNPELTPVATELKAHHAFQFGSATYSFARSETPSNGPPGRTSLFQENNSNPLANETGIMCWNPDVTNPTDVTYKNFLDVFGGNLHFAPSFVTDLSGWTL